MVYDLVYQASWRAICSPSFIVIRVQVIFRMGLDVRSPLDHLLYDLFISVRVRVLFLRYLRHRNACYVIGPIGGLCADDAYSLQVQKLTHFPTDDTILCYILSYIES